jgi:ribosomal subunit interface protein
MIQLQTTGRHYDLDPKILKYVDDKLGKLDRYLPRRVRDGLAGRVVLELDESLTQDQHCICEVHFEVKGEQMQAREATLNMYAAIDICEQKLKSQILTYKSKHEPARNRRQRLWNKVVGRELTTTDIPDIGDTE